MNEQYLDEPDIPQIILDTKIVKCAICRHPVSELVGLKFGKKYVCKNCFHEPLRAAKIKELMDNENKKMP